MKKEITNFLPRLRGKRWSVMALAWMALAGGTAWGQQISIVWEGEELPAEGGEFYLYNKGGGGFLVGGNDYGTHISIGERGILCTLIPDGEGYKIQTYPAQNWFVHPDGWVDNSTAAVFSVKDTNEEDDVSIYTFSKDGGLMNWTGNDNMYVDYSGGDASVDKAQWLLVSAAQYMEKNVATLEAASKENPADATFYIKGADFNRNQQNGWKKEWDGGNEPVIGGPADGKNTTNMSAEAYNNNRVDIYQVLTGLKNGRYGVYCQGFYRPGGSVVAGGAQNAYLYAGDNALPLPLLDDASVNGMVPSGNAFAAGRYKTEAVEAIVVDGTLRIGIKKDVHINSDWIAFDNFRLSYLGEVNASEAFKESLKTLAGCVEDFTGLGATAIAEELQKVYDDNEDASDEGLEEAQAAVSGAVSSAKAVQADVEALVASINTVKSLYAKVEDGTYVLCTTEKETLNQSITDAEKALAETNMDNMAETASTMSGNLDAAASKAKQWIGLAYPLTKAKALADAITGLDEEDAYKKVVADMDKAEITYEEVVADVAALNLVCREAMTVEFLAQASAESPIDLTSFIRNPNIYQVGTIDDKDKRKELDGWTIADWASADNHNSTLDVNGDTELYCYSWSGNADNNVGKAHYYTQIGGEVNLPDGTYLLKAATYCTRQPERIWLYASVDNENLTTEGFNGNKSAYDAAKGINDGATTELTVSVTGGRLYLGVKGNNTVTNSGQSWNADNFRLYYIGAPEAASQNIGVSETGVTTYYSANAFTVPEGLTGGVVTGVAEGENVLTVDWRYTAGSTVPSYTGVILKGAHGAYVGEYSVANVSRPEDNLLEGTLVATAIDAEGYKYYKLAEGEKGLGFYFDATDGSSIMNGANKAYLALPENEAQEVNFLALDFGTTGITDTALAAEDVRVDVYSISGVLVRSGVKASEALDGLSKGIYIVNGKKILK